MGRMARSPAGCAPRRTATVSIARMPTARTPAHAGSSGAMGTGARAGKKPMLKIKSLWKSIALAGVVVLVIATFVVIDALVTSPQETELAAAQARWERRPFSHYRLVCEISSHDP